MVGPTMLEDNTKICDFIVVISFNNLNKNTFKSILIIWIRDYYTLIYTTEISMYVYTVPVMSLRYYFILAELILDIV